MEMPKRIEKLIDRRAKLAKELNSADCELGKWIDKNGINVDSYDYWSGYEE